MNKGKQMMKIYTEEIVLGIIIALAGVASYYMYQNWKLEKEYCDSVGGELVRSYSKYQWVCVNKSIQ